MSQDGCPLDQAERLRLHHTAGFDGSHLAEVVKDLGGRQIELALASCHVELRLYHLQRHAVVSRSACLKLKAQGVLQSNALANTVTLGSS